MLHTVHLPCKKVWPFSYYIFITSTNLWLFAHLTTHIIFVVIVTWMCYFIIICISKSNIVVALQSHGKCCILNTCKEEACICNLRLTCMCVSIKRLCAVMTFTPDLWFVNKSRPQKQHKQTNWAVSLDCRLASFQDCLPLHDFKHFTLKLAHHLRKTTWK